MARIYIISDFSSSQPWLYSLLAANAVALAKSGINLAPLNPWAIENVPHHCHLWIPQPMDLPPGWSVEQWGQMGSILDSGKDLLLLAHTTCLDAHKYFLEKMTADFPGHSARMLVIIGNPLIALEQRHREAHLSLETGEYYGNCYLNFTPLRENAAKYIGEENITVLVNDSQSVASSPQPGIAAHVCNFLGCGNLPVEQVSPQDALFFKSHDARILINVKSVRYNDWPRLDKNAYAAIIANLDKDTEEMAVTPFALRKKMLDKMKEQQLILPDMACPATPDFLLAEKTQAAEEVLSVEAAREVAAALPPEMANALKTRFAQDRHILSEDQKIFARQLGQDKSGEYEHIGEPELPVELTVLTMTYNHERYIGQCIESVACQQTGFPVRHVVLDHNSTDGTAAIIEEYARKNPFIQPVLLSRRAHPENVTGLFLRCRTKYAALCDGDDYFADPFKLQKQVDFLETRVHCALCFHPVAVLFENGEKPFRFPPVESLPRRRNHEFYLADLTTGNFIQTNSVVYRWRFAAGLPSWFRADVCPGDWYWNMLHAEKGRIGFLPETMSVYRRHNNALYRHAFLDTMRHWQEHGLSELAAFKAYNEHFENRYFRNFSALANGVFAAFFNMATEENDPKYLEAATKAFPEFAVEFYRYVNTIGRNALHKKSKDSGKG